MGGTNKTPFVEMLARRFLALGLRPGIVTRGYGGKKKGRSPLLVINGQGKRDEVGDESLLLSSRLPDVPSQSHSTGLLPLRGCIRREAWI